MRELTPAEWSAAVAERPRVFVGGPKDGDRERVRPELQLRGFVQYLEVPQLLAPADGTPLECTTHTYVAMPLFTSNYGVFDFIMHHDSLQPEEAMRMLVAGYRQPKEKARGR